MGNIQKREVVLKPLYPYDIYKPTSSSFCTVSKGNRRGNWVHCRESFNYAWNKKNNRIGFSHGQGEREKIAAFLAEAETKLKLRQKSKIIPVKNQDKISIVALAPWWTTSALRRQLITILLRSARNYDLATKNFNKALLSNRYAKSTAPAVEKFFKGYTKFRKKPIGKKRVWNRWGWNKVSANPAYGWSRTFSSKKNLENLIK